MKHKKVAAALSAAVAGASVLAGIRYAVGKRKPKAEPETAIQEEGLTEGKLRECLLRLFRLYEDSEFDDSAEFLGDGSEPREYEADVDHQIICTYFCQIILTQFCHIPLVHAY